MMKSTFFPVFSLFFAAMVSASYAADVAWKSSAGGDLTEPTNWVGDALPEAGDKLDFSAITSAQTLTGVFDDDRVFTNVTFGTGVITLGDGGANACSLHLSELLVERVSQTEDYGWMNPMLQSIHMPIIPCIRRIEVRPRPMSMSRIAAD